MSEAEQKGNVLPPEVVQAAIPKVGLGLVTAMRDARRVLAKVIPRDCHQDKDRCIAFCTGKRDTLWTLIHTTYWTLNEALADGHCFTDEELAP